MLRIPSLLARVAALAVTLVAVVAAAPALAASGVSSEGEVSWSVEPVPTSEGARAAFEYLSDPGTQIDDSLLITNRGTTSADFLIYATDATNEFETGAFSLLKRDQTPIDSGAWITMASDTLTIGPGQQATVPFTLVIPSDATPGDHVAGIVASVLSSGTEEGAAVTLEQRVGARVYLTVSGVPDVGVEASGFVSGFTPEWNPFAPGTMNVTYDVKNIGNIRLDVDQSIQVVGPFNIVLGELSPEPLSNLLPRQSVRVTEQLPSIAALALAWSTVTLVPSKVGASEEDNAAATPTDTPTAGAEALSDDAAVVGDVIVVDDEPEFIPASSTTFGLAVSWTLLALAVIVLLTIYLVWRYVTATRERLYDAIDEAAAAARVEALESGTERA